MLDMHLKPEKYLTAEDVGCLVGRGERLVQQMYRAHLIDAAELRRGKVVFSPSEARRWKNWYWEHWRDYEKYLCASEKILAGFFAAGASVALMLGAIGLWRQGIPVLLALGLILPAAFLVPLPRPRPGRRFQQVQVTVAGVATGLFLSDILHHVLGHNEPEIGYVALMMMVCVLVCLCLAGAWSVYVFHGSNWRSGSSDGWARPWREYRVHSLADSGRRDICGGRLSSTDAPH